MEKNPAQTSLCSMVNLKEVMFVSRVIINLTVKDARQKSLILIPET